MTDDVPHTRRHPWLGWLIAAVVVFLVFCIAWIAVRGIGASASLSSAVRTTDEVRDVVNAGSAEGLTAATKRIAADTANARVLTSDPIWRGAELVPWLGANLTALREVSAAADDIAQDAAPHLVQAAAGANLATMGLTGARLPIAPLVAVQPQLEDAAAVLGRAQDRLASIDPGGLLPPFRGVVEATHDEIRTVAQATARLAVAARVLPAIAAADGPRNVLVVVQNNAELRSSGGTPLAYALLRVDGGTTRLVKVAGYGTLAPFPTPVAELTPLSRTLFGDAPALRVQDALSAPAFPEAATLVARMWTARAGDRVDAVVALDAVSLARLLSATGPLTVGGVEFTDENAAAILLGGTADHAAPASPATAAALVSQVFTTVANGTADPRRTLAALVAAGDAGRARVWLADPAAQETVARTTLGGILPADRSGAVHVAVLANAGEGGWLGAYADDSVTAALGSCGPDGRTVLRVTVTWRNTLSPEAAASLPASVLGPSDPAGTQRVRIAVIGPRGWTAGSADAGADGDAGDAGDAGADGADADRRAAQQDDVVVAPGATERVTVEFTAPDAARPRVHTRVTPLVGKTPVATGDLACG